MAIRLFGKHKDIEGVIHHLRTNKAFKERVPEKYLDALKRVEALFFYQTVYDSNSEELVALEAVPQELQETLEPGFLGDPAVLASRSMLRLYVQGKLDKKTLEERPNYLHVLDMNRLRQDVRLNSVTE